MEWRYLKMPFDAGNGLSITIQQVFLAAYQAHVAAGRGFLPQAGVFVRSYAPDDIYEFYFSPQVVRLLGPVLDAYGVKPCEVPQRAGPDNHRHRGLGLIVGEASSWDLVK